MGRTNQLSQSVHLAYICVVSLFLLWTGCTNSTSVTSGNPLPIEKDGIRVVAEWEPHAATWIQWPRSYEAQMRPAFARVIEVIQQYEPVHIIANIEREKEEARLFLKEKGVVDSNCVWHCVAIDNAWIRDNGPVYVTDNDSVWIQNWKFDGWGGNFGSFVESTNDNKIPQYIAGKLGISARDYTGYVLERGNLEFNGAGILVLNWDCQNQRNPGKSKEEHEEILSNAFGVDTIIWAYGHDEEDGTTGHIDGIARFCNSNTILIGDFETDIDTERLVSDCKAKGVNVIRFSGSLNWLVGNGFVAAMGENDPEFDEQIKAILEAQFPNRDIHIIDGSVIGEAGGGIHCITNDQPLL